MKPFRALSLLAVLLCAFSLEAQTQSSNIVNLTGVAPPAAPAITPPLVPASGYVGLATNVNVTGTGFLSNCTATLNGASVPITFNSTTSITLNIPAGKVVLGNNPVQINCSLPLLTMNSPVTLPNATVGLSYSQSLASLAAVTGGLPPYTFSCDSPCSLPTGLTLSASGVVSGLPSGAGSFNFGFTVTDSSGLALRNGQIEVKPGVFALLHPFHGAWLMPRL